MLKYKITFNSYIHNGKGVNEIAPNICVLTFDSGKQKTIKDRLFIKAIQKDYMNNLPVEIVFKNSSTKEIAQTYKLK